MPYDFSIEKCNMYNTALEASNDEMTLKNCNKDNKYLPLKEFGGRYECFRELDMSCILQ